MEIVEFRTHVLVGEGMDRFRTPTNAVHRATTDEAGGVEGEGPQTGRPDAFGPHEGEGTRRTQGRVIGLARNRTRRKTREVKRGPAQQAATADVLKAISRSTFDLQTVLNTLVESAARLREADQAAINRYDGSAAIGSASPNMTQAFWGFSPEHIAYVRDHPIPMGRGSTPGRAIVGTTHRAHSRCDGRCGLRVRKRKPNCRPANDAGGSADAEGAPIGVIILQRRAVRPFTKQQIELVETFADQAVIAIEKSRLFDEVQARTKELAELLEQRTATSEVLGVISVHPASLSLCFRTILENTTRVCGASLA